MRGKIDVLKSFFVHIKSFCIFAEIGSLIHMVTAKIILHRIISVVWLTIFLSENRSLTQPPWWDKVSCSERENVQVASAVAAWTSRLDSAAFFAATPCLRGRLSQGATYLFCLLNKPVVATRRQSDRQRRVGGHRNSTNVKASSCFWLV